MSAPNPFAPPASAIEAPPASTDVRLFGPRAIAAHAVLLTPLVGSILAAINQWRLGDRAAFWRTLLTYGLPSAVLLVILFFVSAGASPIRAGALAWGVLVARQLYREHDVLFKRHVAAGGRPARWVLATAASFGVFLAIAVIAAVAGLGSEP